jgi:hypothetical protein
MSRPTRRGDSSRFAKTAIYPCGFIKPEYVGDPQTSGPETVRGCSPLARSEPILVGLLTRVGFCFVPGGEGRSLTVWFWIRGHSCFPEIIRGYIGGSEMR